jgi:hypothetical protein
MRVTWPDVDFQAWQPTLTDWQREALGEVGRGTFNQYNGHHRMQVVVTNYGFDVLGLTRVSAFHSDGTPVEDAWRLDWVCEVHPDQINHGDWERKYTQPPKRKREYRGEITMQQRRRDARWRKRQRRREARQREEMQAELDRLTAELQEWVGSPLSFPHYDRIGQLQEALSADHAHA